MVCTIASGKELSRLFLPLILIGFINLTRCQRKTLCTTAPPQKMIPIPMTIDVTIAGVELKWRKVKSTIPASMYHTSPANRTTTAGRSYDSNISISLVCLGIDFL